MGCFKAPEENPNGMRYRAWLQMVVAHILVGLSYEDIALILTVNDPDRDRHQQRIKGEPPTPFEADKLRNDFEELSVGIRSAFEQHLFFDEHLRDERVTQGELVEIKAGMTRAKKPVEEQKLDIDCLQYIDELPTAEIGELYVWAKRQTRGVPNWEV